MALDFDAPLLRWGNSYALRITRKQAEALGARPGTPLHAHVETAGPTPWSFPTFTVGDGEAWSLRHDEVLEEAVDEEMAAWRES